MEYFFEREDEMSELLEMNTGSKFGMSLTWKFTWHLNKLNKKFFQLHKYKHKYIYMNVHMYVIMYVQCT